MEAIGWSCIIIGADYRRSLLAINFVCHHLDYPTSQISPETTICHYVVTIDHLCFLGGMGCFSISSNLFGFNRRRMQSRTILFTALYYDGTSSALARFQPEYTTKDSTISHMLLMI